MTTLHPAFAPFSSWNNGRYALQEARRLRRAAQTDEGPGSVNPSSPKVVLRIIYASISGSTEYVVDELIAQLKKAKPDLVIEKQRAELAEAEDLKKGDVLILASGTWNTGGQEGQLSPAMNMLLKVKAEDIKLDGKPMAFISLGDERYYFTTRCTEHFMQFMMQAGGKQLVTPLIIVNEPYEQGEKIAKWGEKLVEKLSS